MGDPTWAFAQFALNIVLAVVTISLFLQGQRDRRRVAEDRRREQAAKISVLAREHVEPSRPGAWNVKGSIVEIRNDSDAPVTRVQVVSLRALDWGTYREWVESSANTSNGDPYEAELVEVDPERPSLFGGLYLGPGESIVHHGAVRGLVQHELHFVDGAGTRWVRSWDGRLWRKAADLPWWAQVFQSLEYVRFVGVPLRGLVSFAGRRLRVMAPRIPLSMRFVYLLRREVPSYVGNSRPWRIPVGAPERDWPFQEFVRLVLCERNEPIDDVDANSRGFLE